MLRLRSLLLLGCLLALLPVAALAATPTSVRLAQVLLSTKDVPQYAVVSSQVPATNDPLAVAALNRVLVDRAGNRIAEHLSIMTDAAAARAALDAAASPSFLPTINVNGLQHQLVGPAEIGDQGLVFRISGVRTGDLYIWRTGLAVIVFSYQTHAAADSRTAFGLAQLQQAKLDAAPDVTGLNDPAVRAARQSPQQLYDLLASSPFADGELPAGYTPVEARPGDLDANAQKYHALGSLLATLTGPDALDQITYLVLPSVADGRAAFAGFVDAAGPSYAITSTLTLSGNPGVILNATTPPVGTTAASGASSTSICVALVDTVLVAGVSGQAAPAPAQPAALQRSSSDNACALTLAAIAHLQRVASQ